MVQGGGPLAWPPLPPKCRSETAIDRLPQAAARFGPAGWRSRVASGPSDTDCQLQGAPGWAPRLPLSSGRHRLAAGSDCRGAPGWAPTHPLDSNQGWRQPATQERPGRLAGRHPPSTGRRPDTNWGLPPSGRHPPSTDRRPDTNWGALLRQTGGTGPCPCSAAGPFHTLQSVAGPPIGLPSTWVRGGACLGQSVDPFHPAQPATCSAPLASLPHTLPLFPSPLPPSPAQPRPANEDRRRHRQAPPLPPSATAKPSRRCRQAPHPTACLPCPAMTLLLPALPATSHV